MGNLQVRFLEGWAPAMAPGHSPIVPGNVSVLSEARFSEQTGARARCSGALSIKPFESSRPAADAGPMGIEWSERAVESCGQAVRRRAKDNPLVGKFAEAQNGC